MRGRGPLLGLFRSCVRRRPKNQRLPPESPAAHGKAPAARLGLHSKQQPPRATQNVRETVLVPCTTAPPAIPVRRGRRNKGRETPKRRLAPGGRRALLPPPPPPPALRSTRRLRTAASAVELRSYGPENDSPPPLAPTWLQRVFCLNLSALKDRSWGHFPFCACNEQRRHGGGTIDLPNAYSSQNSTRE